MNKIKHFRLENKMTLKELSEQAEIAIGYLSDLEHDVQGLKNPSRSVMLRISEALGKSVPDVFFPEDTSSENM